MQRDPKQALARSLSGFNLTKRDEIDIPAGGEL